MAEQDLGNFQDFLNSLGGGDGESGEEVNPLFNPETIITLRSTSGGDDFAIPVEGPTSIRDLIEGAGLAVSPSIEYWVDGAPVGPEHVVAPGATVTAVGQVKGG